MQVNILTNKQFNDYIQNTIIIKDYYASSAGTIEIFKTDLGIFQAEFVEMNLRNKNSLDDLSKLLLVGTDFQVKVWQAALKIPLGQTISYQKLASIIGKPKAYRAVANALSQNKLAYFVPCHRVIQKNGSLGGYKWGITRKSFLIKSESAG